MTQEALPRRTDHKAAFWSLVVGLPAALSVLRLWVESGGDLQITLLLVSNVSPLNLVAALFATVTQVATVVLIALFSAGGILRAAVEAAPSASSLRLRPPVLARVFVATPVWFMAAAYLMAILTWRIVYLPLLLPAAMAAFQFSPWRLPPRWLAAGFCLAALGGYGWLIGPAVMQAWRGSEYLVAWLLVLPPLIALGVAGPIPGWFARTFSPIALLAVIGIATAGFFYAVRTPILPLVVIELKGRPVERPEFIRGHVVSVDDLHLVILQEQGGVRYLPLDDVGPTVLCATPEELPTTAIRLRGYHVEDSILTAVGRQVRPRVQVDPLCRIAKSATT
ncbi:hypothetical protein Rhe02_35450 [Rhizocola hellebori]|uniref:Uncharacterized protein n=1 Tax=Rhizocola hellebori TaxID=1392758 RepID=A0A8J3Q7E2_9ACTN|nr:hypothetical protein [Rhizocola hellebori]GIH05478.1 hypothetical protein Rhe02_35450 [Rhizocola hellebori]